MSSSSSQPARPSTPSSLSSSTPNNQLGRVTLILLLVTLCEITYATSQEKKLQWLGLKKVGENIVSHSCIHDQIIEQRKRPDRKVYSVTPQVYKESDVLKPLYLKGRSLLGISKFLSVQKDVKQPIRIYLNYDAVGHSPDRDCRNCYRKLHCEVGGACRGFFF